MDRLDWIAACAHQLQCRWRTVDPTVLEDVAADLWAVEDLQALGPTRAAQEWPEPAKPAPPSANGILSKVPGDLVAQGNQQLPPPGPSSEPSATVVDVPERGQVRVTYEPREARHRGRGSQWFWLATRADPVG